MKVAARWSCATFSVAVVLFEDAVSLVTGPSSTGTWVASTSPSNGEAKPSQYLAVCASQLRCS